MAGFELQLGDVFLYKTIDKGLYSWFVEHGLKALGDFLIAATGDKYIHAAIYVGQGYQLAADGVGVHLYKMPMSAVAQTDIYRYKALDTTKIKQAVNKYFNAPYDYVDLLLNGALEVLSVNIPLLKEFYEGFINYENPTQMICSELVARVYRFAGYPIAVNDEFCSPEDIARNPNFKLLI